MYLLLNIGGTHLRFGVSKDGQTVDQFTKVYTPQSFNEAVQLIKDTGLNMLDHPSQVVVGVAGILNQDKQSLYHSPYLPDWNNKPLQTALSSIFNCPVNLVNDAQLEALGEATQGAAKGYKIVAYLVVGTGCGGARIVGGKIDDSTFGFEPGHHLINFSQKLDKNPRSLEDFVSGVALAKLYHKKAKEIFDPVVWDEVSRILALGIHNTICFWSPEIIVLGGSISQHLDLKVIQESLEKTFIYFPTLPKIVLGKFQDQAGFIGALSYAGQRLVS